MATITLDLTAGQATRLQDAMTIALHLDQPATLDDAKGYIIADLKQLVRNTERREAAEAAKAGLPVDIDIT